MKITWKKIIKKEKKKKYFSNIILFLKKEKKNKKIIYPKKKNILQAFKITNFHDTKVVILGQDPYPNKYQAHGLAFSVPKKNNYIPPSVKNIYKEIKREFKNFIIPKHGYLMKWAKQGVLLLNSILTVENKKPGSHKNIGWEIFTNNIIKYINLYLKNIIFVLWGFLANKKKKFINPQKHLILSSSHPSPLSVKNFIGCNHFKKINEFLKHKKKKPISW